MKAGVANNLESLVGPPSELVNISDFLRSGQGINQTSVDPSVFWRATSGRGWEQLSEEERASVKEECRVDDLQDNLFSLWNDPTLSGHILKDHESTINSLNGVAKPYRPGRRANLPNPVQSPSEIMTLKRNFNSIKLEAWKLPTDSAMFMRTPKNSDYNALGSVKVSTTSICVADPSQALLSVTIQNRLSWCPTLLSRASQHVLLSSQTLKDLCDIIPCPSHRNANEITNTDGAIHYETRDGTNGGGCVICIEGIAYNDDDSEVDYTDALVQHLANVSKNPPVIEKSLTSMQNTTLASLSLRINEPYWMLHYGNCEHFIVVDRIRLFHPSDQLSGYPLTLQITPPILDLCRACSKVPAVLSVVNDVRLGESPCIMCGPCWNNMGSSQDKNVIVVPLLTYDM